MGELLTTRQLADYLQLKPVTIRRKAAKGEIPSIKIGSQLRFDQERIDSWLLEQRMANSSRILVVDDEQVIVNLVRDTLEIGGFQVTGTSSSLEALEIIGRQSFDLIFIDLLMPKTDGAELFKRIRQVDRDVPVVIITGYPSSDIMAKAMEHGPFLVIKKPFLIEEIINATRMFNRNVAIAV